MPTTEFGTGQHDRLGATVVDGGVNFAIFSHHAAEVDLLLFDRPDAAQPSKVFGLDPALNRTGSYWHICVQGLKAGQLYGYRLNGPFTPENGQRFDPSKVLLDPYARAVVDDQYDRSIASQYGVDNCASAMKSVVVDPSAYDWEGDRPLRRKLDDAAIYEMHVRGFTNHSSSGLTDAVRGTYAGVIEKIPYLQQLGVQIVESGVGNTLNSNHTVVRRMVLDSLRYWVQEMHVDGFRFDLASVLYRGQENEVLQAPPLLWDIDSDPVLAGTRIIAEAWDAAGLYQVGSFVGDRWAVWNGHYRDTVRRFVKGDSGVIRDLGDAICGSSHIFSTDDQNPMRSVNFVTAHDGFTLNDLVSYSDKHNDANGEDNQDGSDQNDSWNCGTEGPTDNRRIEALRQRQIRNFFTILLLSQGRPMLLMGDEVRRTQGGNNNAYSQDNEISWFDWNRVDDEHALFRFVSGLLRFRQTCELYGNRGHRFEPSDASVVWHGVQLHQPDWGDQSHSIAFELVDSENEDNTEHLYIVLNAYWEPLDFQLPHLPAGRRWARLVDTAQPPPEDYAEAPVSLDAGQHTYPVADRSAVVLLEQSVTQGGNPS